MASPACPAPMIDRVVVCGTMPLSRGVEVMSTGTPLVSTSKTADRAFACSTICRSFSGGASPSMVKLERIFW